jgi:trimeric autotransporter adhesin
MKKIVYSLLLVCSVQYSSFSQNVGINADGSTPDANAMLDIKASNKGLLIPRTSTASRNGIPKTKGLLVYDTTTNSFWFNDGNAWNTLFSGAGSVTSSGSKNAIGTLDFNTSFPYNTDYGYLTLSANTNGQSNTAIGYESMLNNTSGFNNTASGASSMLLNTTGAYNTAYGANSLFSNKTGSSNTAVGEKAMISNSTGGANAAFGSGALYNNTIGNYNVSVGFQSLYYNNTDQNVAVGYQSLFDNSTGNGSVAVGFQSLYANNGGGGHVAIGYMALYSNTTGKINTAIGSTALYSNTTGNYNVATGNTALYVNTTGGDNTANGFQALYSNTTGNKNTAIGYYAMGVNVTGSNNTGLGYNADVGSANLSNATAIGYNAIATASNTVQIGDSNITDLYTNTKCTFHAKAFLQYSDARLKYAVQPLMLGLQFIQLLQPVTYFFKNDHGDHLYSGFIAQDVEKTAQQLGANFSGVYKPANDKDYYALNYQDFIMPLVKSVQELSAENNSLRKKLDDLTARIEMLEKKSGK